MEIYTYFLKYYPVLIAQPWSESNMFWKKYESSYKRVKTFAIKSLQNNTYDAETEFYETLRYNF